MDAAYFAINLMMFHDLRQICLANSTDGGKIICPGGPACLCARPPPGHPNFHDLISQKPASAAAAKGFFPNRILVHFDKTVAHRLKDISGGLKVSCGSSHIARIVISDQKFIIGRFINLKGPPGNQVPRQVADVEGMANI